MKRKRFVIEYMIGVDIGTTVRIESYMMKMELSSGRQIGYDLHTPQTLMSQKKPR
ncbi:hypothetical protein ACVNP0_06735 [Staphylococcus aureus]